jgi:hypothetical protein
MEKLFLKIATILYTLTFFASIAYAAPITQGIAFAFRDNEGPAPLHAEQGDNFSMGIALVLPDGNSGTTSSATNLATGYTINPLPNWSHQSRPGLFALDIDFLEAQANNWLSPWEITLINASDYATRITPNRTDAQKMEFVK